MVELLSKSPEDQEQWKRLFADMQLGRELFEGIVRGVAGQLRTVRAGAETRGNHAQTRAQDRPRAKDRPWRRRLGW